MMKREIFRYKKSFLNNAPDKRNAGYLSTWKDKNDFSDEIALITDGRYKIKVGLNLNT